MRKKFEKAVNYAERVGIAEVWRTTLAREDVPIEDEVNDAKSDLFILKEKEKANDHLWEVTTMHEILVESLWQHKIQKKSIISYINSDSETYSMVE